MIDWNNTYAAIWRQRQEYLRPVRHIDPIRLEQLLGIDRKSGNWSTIRYVFWPACRQTTFCCGARAVPASRRW
ncbi:hypothetical protein [Methylomonas koyamae]|uniref:hypothetical protein n=1 Tax=Methylomonas koyamae TaxID=702114 RepID=UPI000B255C50